MKYNIAVTGTGSLIGQAIIKCIKKSTSKNVYNIIGFDYFKETVGSFLCDKNIILSDIYINPELEKKWLDEIVFHLIENSIDILFVGIDFELKYFAKHKKFLEDNAKCKIVVSPENVINIGNDKYLTYKFLKDNNLFYPKTFLPDEVDLKNIDYPVIIKPRVGARSRGVYKVDNFEELNIKIMKIKNPIIQEYIGDIKSEYTCGVIYFDGELKKDIVLKRSLKDGNTYISEHKKNTEKIIYDYIKKITNKLKPYGSCNLQLRIDEKGIPKLFEINPRHSGTTYIRSLFGYNEIIYIINYLIHGKESKFSLVYGRALRYFEEKLIK